MNFISNLPIKKYIVSFALAFLITLLILSAASIIFSFFPPPEWVFGIFSNYSYLLSGFTAAFFCARKSSKRGFVTGIYASVLYIAILIMLGGIIFKSDISAIPLIRIFSLSALCGGVGGILGINCR